MTAGSLLVTPAEAEAFARLTGDASPLHTDEAYARRTPFGEPVVHGVLCLLRLLAEGPPRPGLRLTALKAHFSGPVFRGQRYDWTVTEADGPHPGGAEGSGPVRTVFRLLDGRQVMLEAEAAYGPGELRTGPVPSDPPRWAAEAADEPLERLVPGRRAGEDYRPDWQGLRGFLDRPGAGESGIGAEHAAVLAWASYVVGMEAPGRPALLAGLDIDFEPAHGQGPFTARAEVTATDARFRTVHLTGGATAGSLTARVALRAFARRHAAAPEAARIRELMTGHLTAAPLDGRVAFLAGGSRGLGAAIAQALVLAGCTVHIGYRHSADDADALVAGLGPDGHRLRLEQGDVADPEWCARTRDRVIAEHGRCDLVVLNASPPARVLGLDAASAERAAEHLRHAQALAHAPLTAFAADVAAAGGTLVAVSSAYVRTPRRGLAHYVAAKGALEALVSSSLAEHPALRALVARPPRLATSFSDAVASPEEAMAVEPVAAAIVRRLIEGGEAGTVDILEDFREPASRSETTGTPQAPGTGDGTRGLLAVAGTFTLDPLRPVLEAWTDRLGLGLDVRLAPYNQVFQELLDPASTFAANEHGCNVVLLRLEDWPGGSDGERTADEFAEAAAAHGQRGRVPLIVVVCPPSPGARQRTDGGAADLEERLRNALAGLGSVHVIGSDRWNGGYRVDAPHDADRLDLAHIPYTPAAYAALGTAVARTVHALLSPPFKVLVLDCDNTLWRGVCGEDGPGGVVVGEAHRRLQEWAVERQSEGVLVCLASKNAGQDVDAVFRRHPGMPLRPEHIAARRVDWNPKPGNIASLAAELGLGPDSVVFLDDNPVEVAVVRAELPAALALTLPADEAEWPAFLDRLWAFDRPAVTDEDRARTAMYRAGREREKLRGSAGTFADFIAGLGLRVEVRRAEPRQLARVSQLTQRTNQFNLSAVRRTEPELRALLDGGARCWVAEAADRFGDYGLVGAAIVRDEAGSLVLDTFLLSCRVLGRGVEHAFLAGIARAEADTGGPKTLAATYVPTGRNTPARSFFDSVLVSAEAEDGSVSYGAPLEDVARIVFRPAEGGDDAGPAATKTVLPPAAASAGASARLAALAQVATGPSDAELLRRWLEGEGGRAAVDLPAREPAGHEAAASRSEVLDAVREVLRGVREVSPDRLRDDTTLESLALESLEIVDATVALEKRFGRLPRTLFFEHRTLGDLAGAVAGAGTEEPSETDCRTRSVAVTTRGDEPTAGAAADDGAADDGIADDGIAVVGIAGRYPGAPDLTRLWDNLRHGRESIGDAALRWGPGHVHPDGGPDKTYTSAAGLLDGVDEFDALFFNLAPSEAETMDPQQRLFLQTAYHALEDAGHAAGTLGRDVGVYVASMGPDYALFSARAALDGHSRYPNTDLYQIANRVSYFFDFTGPSLAVDSACSGSGVALQLACEAIASGAVSAAIAGGVNLILHPARRVQYAQLGMLSRSGRCRPFGAGADGIVTSEGVGAVVLRPLRDALADGDRIHGVIKAACANSDGRTNGFTVPSPDAQAALISATLKRAGTDPSTIGYVEAHGTGTPLGDPIEIRGLSRAFGPSAARGGCPVGSVKGNIGHCEAAAAMAGLSKVLLQLRHRTLVPSLHTEQLNPHIDFARSPFRVQRETADWIAVHGQPRRAALSSFGAGGVNVHLVVEEAPGSPATDKNRAPGDGPELILLSAPDDERLLEVCARLAAHLRGPGAHQRLADIAYTLRTGRTAFAARIALVADDREQLAGHLARLAAAGEKGLAAAAAAVGTAAYGRAAGTPALAEVFDGSEEITGVLRNLGRRGEPARLGALWAHGARIDWQQVMPPSGQRRTSLPGYPFRPTRHWLPEPYVSAERSGPAEPPAPTSGVAYYVPERLSETLVPGSFPDAEVVVVGGLPAWSDGHGRVVTDVSGLAANTGENRDLVVVDRRALDEGFRADRTPLLDGVAAAARLALGGRRVTYVLVCRPAEEQPGSAAVTGFGRALTQETGLLRTVRVEAGATEPTLSDVLAEAAGTATEVRLDGTGRSVRRWRRLPGDARQGSAPSVFRTGGHYLITGGAGGIGRHLAAHLTAEYRASVTLIGRTAPSEEVRRLRQDVLAHGGTVHYVRADVTDPDAVAAALTEAREHHGPLHGVIHAAGVLQDGPFRDRTDEELGRVLAPKTTGAVVTDEATAAENLDFFLVMSSFVGTFGNAGQAGYCAANRFLDAFAEQRAARAAAGERHGRSVSAVWPLWEDGGMRMPDATRKLTATTLGLSAIDTATALRAVEEALRLGRPTVLIGCGDPERIDAALAALEPSPGMPAAPPASASGSGLHARLCAEAAALVKVPVERIDPAAEFGDYGFNSLLFTDFANRLNDVLGLTLTPVVFFEHPTIDALAGMLGRRYGDQAPVRSQEPGHDVSPHHEASRTVEARKPAPVAVIGMAGRFPGSPDLDTYWNNLLQGRDLVGPSAGRCLDGSTPHGAFLDDILAFDASFFGISPREARLMDPQQRLFLETGWQAVEDAGYDPRSLAGTATGVFVGATLTDYSDLLRSRGEEVVGHTLTGHVRSIIANRLSYLLDLRGPSETVDTACSSSLTALHRAVRALAAGDCDQAVVGGVNALFTPEWFASLAKAGMLSDSGRCWTFDTRADGFVRGEGVGAVVLKPLDAALRDGDTVRAVIRGSAVNHGGRAHSLTAPNPAAQADVVTAALREAGADPRTVSYIETHGTGTRLGDPIEAAGLREAFTRPGARDEAPWCALGAVKTNIGHLESAAGIAGLIKAVLAVTHRTLPPNAAGERANEHLELEGGPFTVLTTRRPWQPLDREGAPMPLRAGVSAFGFGGANAHVVIEEPPAPGGRIAAPDTEELVVLSAAGPERLREYAHRLRTAVAAGTSYTLADLAHTSRVGRPALPVRLAMVVRSPHELLDLLDAHLAGRTAPGLYKGAAGTGDGTPAVTGRPADAGQHESARTWVAGHDLTWPADPARRRVPFPTYPFDHTVSHGPALVAPGDGAGQNTPREDHAPRLLAREWAPAPLPHRTTARRRTVALLIGGETGTAALEALAGHDEADWIVLRSPSQLPPLTAREYETDFDDHAAGRRTAEELLRRHGPVDAVVDLVDAAGEGGFRREAGRVGLLQVLAAHGRTGGGLRLVHLTRGAGVLRTEADGAAPAPVPGGARMGALVRSLGAEYGAVRSVSVDADLDPADVGGQLAVCLAELAEAADCEVRYRDGVRHVPRLVPTSAAHDAGPGRVGAFAIDPDRAYVVTGGTGGLGLAAAELLVDRGARRLALLGRRPLPPRDQWQDPAAGVWWAECATAVRRMEEAGAEVMLHAGPLSDRAELERFLSEVRSRWGAVAGVLHAAGSAAGPSPFTDKPIDEITEVWEPKGTGLLALDTALAGDEPDFVVLYSSVSAAVPGLAVGLADYAAANAVLDAYAAHAGHRARARGARTRYLALDWGSWTGLGMGEVTSPRYRGLGLGALTRAQGLALLDQALGTSAHTSLVALAARPGAAEALLSPGHGYAAGPEPDEGPRAAGADVPVAGTSSAAESAPGGASDTVGSGPAPTPHGLAGHCAAHITGVLAEALMLEPGVIRPDAPFADLGVDSILIAGIVGRLETFVGAPLEPSAVLEHPTVARLAAHLADRHADALARRAGVRHAATAPSTVAPLAVIGMAGRFPGATSARAFWDLLREGRSGITEVPRSRWDVATLYSPRHESGRSISKWGGFLDGIEDFDAGYFGVADADAAHMDPLARLFLETAEEAFADAGYRGDELVGRRIGVFAGSGPSGYGRRITLPGRATATGLNPNFIAAHLAHFRDLRGPNLVTDTACSSSLTALHLARQALELGECEMALVGGADLLLDETPYLSLSAGKALSPDGACHVFDAAANGFVPGEGVGALLVKPLERALADGDRILAVIESTAMNNDGRTMGLTTPNPDAQQDVIRDALRKAGVDAASLSYVEAHGTGTMIGDPIELKALTRVFEDYTTERGFCAVGSVKSNVGHLLMAAGMAGLQKVVLSLVHRALPPTLHCEHPNPRFAFEASPFRPNTELRPWEPRHGVRRAGLSAFGFGGTNCHVILREPTDAERDAGPARRTPLAPPVFHRKRHWVDRPGAPLPVQHPHPLLELEELS